MLYTERYLFVLILLRVLINLSLWLVAYKWYISNFLILEVYRNSLFYYSF